MAGGDSCPTPRTPRTPRTPQTPRIPYDDVKQRSTDYDLLEELRSMGFSEDVCSRSAALYDSSALHEAVSWALTEAALTSPDGSTTSSVSCQSDLFSSSSSSTELEEEAMLGAEGGMYSLQFERAAREKRATGVARVPRFEGFTKVEEVVEEPVFRLPLSLLPSSSKLFDRMAAERRDRCRIYGEEERQEGEEEGGEEAEQEVGEEEVTKTQRKSTRKAVLKFLGWKGKKSAPMA